MEYSILKDYITQKDIQTYLSSRVYGDMYWPSFFPLKQVPRLKVETIIGARGNRVAADIVSYNASAPEKRRRKVDVMHTDIPPIRVKRTMDENDLNDFYMLRNMASDESQRQAINLVFEDIDFVVEAVNARLEWLALQAMSQAIVSLTTSNNAGVITETNIDFQLPSANKEYIGSAGGTAGANYYWTTGASGTNDPITDIQVIVNEAKNAGVNLERMYMNWSKYQAFRASDNVKDFVAPYVVYGGTREKILPTQEVVNEALSAQELPQIVVVDTRVDIEDADHDRTSYDPFLNSNSTDENVLFAPAGPLGDMVWCPTAEEQSPPKQAIHTKKGPILISKYRDVDPVSEATAGLLNAFVSWPTIDQCWSLNTESHTAW